MSIKVDAGMAVPAAPNRRCLSHLCFIPACKCNQASLLLDPCLPCCMILRVYRLGLPKSGLFVSDNRVGLGCGLVGHPALRSPTVCGNGSTELAATLLLTNTLKILLIMLLHTGDIDT